jgi:hypothetical protein
MMLQVRRWLPERELVLVADMGFAALELLAALSRRGVICITRLRLDAAGTVMSGWRPFGNVIVDDVLA